MAEQPSLFPAEPYTVAQAPEPEQPLSADRRRTLRQAAGIQAGRHPLTGGPLHPDASTEATRDDPPNLPWRCGSCAHRVIHSGWTAGKYPKCDAEDGKRITGGPGTDVRAWWPACPQYVPTLPLPQVRHG